MAKSASKDMTKQGDTHTLVRAINVASARKAVDTTPIAEPKFESEA
jgi:hypothetical protein